jgi:hypothetical protein
MKDGIGMALLRKKSDQYKSGDLVYCDVLEVAKHEWEFGTHQGKLRSIEAITDNWPWVMSVVLEARETLKVAKLYIPYLNITIRAPYSGIRDFYTKGKEKDDNN